MVQVAVMTRVFDNICVFILVKVISCSRMLHMSIFNKCLLGKFSGSVLQQDVCVVSLCWVILQLNSSDADTLVEIKVHTDGYSWVLNLKSREKENKLCYLYVAVDFLLLVLTVYSLLFSLKYVPLNGMRKPWNLIILKGFCFPFFIYWA